MSDEKVVTTTDGFRYKPTFKSAGPRAIPLRFPVDGLTAYDSMGLMVEFVWVRDVPTDEADARDIQCVSGWPDQGYGFYGFRFDGSIARWSCSKSCE